MRQNTAQYTNILRNHVREWKQHIPVAAQAYQIRQCIAREVCSVWKGRRKGTDHRTSMKEANNDETVKKKRKSETFILLVWGTSFARFTKPQDNK